MLRETLSGSKDPFDGKYTPELVTPELSTVLARWRLWSGGDGTAYFSALDVMVRSAEDRSGTIASVLDNPDINADGKLLGTAEPMMAKDLETQGYIAALTDAIGVGQYLTGQEHPDFPTSWTEMAPPKQGRLGRLAVKAIGRANRRSKLPLEFIDKQTGTEVGKIFTAATSVAWQYVDAFEADTVSLALVKMSALPRGAKRQEKIYKDFQRWSRRFEATSQVTDPDRRLQLRQEIFKDVMGVARRVTSRRTIYSPSPAMGRLTELVSGYDTFTAAVGPQMDELTELINFYEANKSR